MKGDVASPNDLDRLYQTIAAKKGKLDILFANAGIADPVPTPDVTAEHYDKTFGVNARGVYFTVQRALPLMKDGGSIIVNGSGAWQKGYSDVFDVQRHEGGPALVYPHVDR